MIGFLQRVSHASVHVQGELVGEIGQGLLVLVGVEKADTEQQAEKLLHRLLGYRVFADDADKMNLSLGDLVHLGRPGGLLLIPQFTLAADTRKGLRPSFSSAAPPEQGEPLFDYLLAQARGTEVPVANGIFGANMQVSLCNDGPVSFWLQAQ